MLEKEIVLTLADMMMLTKALSLSRYQLYGYSGEHIEDMIKLFRRITSVYTADRSVKLMVFKEPLLR